MLSPACFKLKTYQKKELPTVSKPERILKSAGSIELTWLQASVVPECFFYVCIMYVCMYVSMLLCKSNAVC